MKNQLISHGGSIQNIPGIPDDVKAIYKTVWEISQRRIIDMAADRGAFICQSQSLNIFIAKPSVKQLVSLLFYWNDRLNRNKLSCRLRCISMAGREA